MTWVYLTENVNSLLKVLQLLVILSRADFQSEYGFLKVIKAFRVIGERNFDLFAHVIISENNEYYR